MTGDPVYVKLTRPEGYEDACEQIVIEDAEIHPGFMPEPATEEVERLREEVRALEQKRLELNVTIGERDAEIERLRARPMVPKAQYERLQAELDTEHQRLAACGVAAMQNTPDSVAERIDDGSLYWSASYGDVCRAVDREMRYRKALEMIATGKGSGCTEAENAAIMRDIAKEALSTGDSE